MTTTADSDNRVAIVGMAARLPGAASVDEYWANLLAGVESLTEVTDEQLLAAGIAVDEFEHPDYVRLVPLADDCDAFDAGYFEIGPREAEILDPQHRMFLEVCATALQEAGYDPRTYPLPIGLFGGSATNRYAQRVRRNSKILGAVGHLAIGLANNVDYLTTGVAYRLGLTGPAVSVTTACSTSLVAVHLAIQALRNGDCAIALAGGVEIEVPHPSGYRWVEGGMYSRDGHCRVFDAKASGTNFGAGAGVVVLKRLADARAAGDHIHAVIRGSAINNDGAFRRGFTAPSPVGQQALITAALAAAAVEPDSIGYVEAHGTATEVGDPVEIAALTAAFRAAGAQGTGYCPIGSAKSNIGHLGPAAGVAGLIKTVRILQTGLIPATLHYQDLNPRIRLGESPFRINDALSEWPAHAAPRRAGVSSFGIGGTNAHLILEEAPPAAPSPQAPARWHVIPLSATSDTALATIRAELSAHLRETDPPLGDVAYTLQVGRSALPRRTVVVARETADLIDALEGRSERRVFSAVTSARRVAVSFVFPGQGAQHVDMAREVYEHQRVFREELDACAEILAPVLDIGLHELVFSTPGGLSTSGLSTRLQRTEYAQPALFAIEYALARLWMSLGVEPAAMAGHSVGELVAACLAEVFTLPDALRVVAERGRLMQSLPPGQMLAIPLPEGELAELLGEDVSLAAVNAPKACVASGATEAIGRLQGRLAERGIETQLLRTSHAFHSVMMDPILAEYRAVVAAAGPRTPARPIVSTLTGVPMTAEQATDPGYWVRQLRETVRFADAFRTLAADGAPVLEVGPGQTLTGHARRVLLYGARKVQPSLVMPSLPHAGTDGSSDESLATALARLWAAGVEIDWAAVHTSEPRRRLSLPTYPYERRRYWIEPDPTTESERAATRNGGNTLLSIEDSVFVPSWRAQPLPGPEAADLDQADGPWLVFTPGRGPIQDLVVARRHAGQDVIAVVPGAGFEQPDPWTYSLCVSERAAYDKLLASLSGHGIVPSRIVHGWTATDPAAEPMSPQQVTADSEAGFYSLLWLGQALDAAWPDRPLSVRVVVSHSVDVSGVDRIEPAKAMVFGPVTLLSTESDHLDFQMIDILPGANADAAIAAQLRAEITAEVRDRQVAYRGGRRWIPEYAPIRLADAGPVPPMLKERGVYLLTGGLGGIALRVARALAEAVSARLVLVGRSALPPRRDWPALIDRPDTDESLTARIRAVNEIEAAGGEVLIAVADVTDESAMAEVIARANARFGRIDGVFHAAGVAGGGLALARTREAAARVLGPKVEGTLVLDRLLGDTVDFMMLFSSIVAVTGDFGMVDYVAANAFLDAYAALCSGRSRCVIAVNWCAWIGLEGMVQKAFEMAPSTFRELERGTRYEAVDHPLLDNRLVSRTEQITYSTILDPRTHWFVNEHRMIGTPALPGTAALEMVRAAACDALGVSIVEVSDVDLLRPVVVAERREARVIVQEADLGRYRFVVVSRAASSPSEDWQIHLRGSVCALRSAPVPRIHSIDAIRARCDVFEWVPPVETDESKMVAFGPHWFAVQNAFVGHGEQLLVLRHPDQFHAECDEYVLHPSLLDCATSIGLYVPEIYAAAAGFLPVRYGRTVAHSPLPPSFYSHIRFSGPPSGPDGLFAMDVTLLAEDGRELVVIENFTVAAMDLDGVRGSSPAPAPSPAAIGVRTETDPASALCVTGSEGVDLLWRIMADRSHDRYIVSREPVPEKMRRMTEFGRSLSAAPLLLLSTDDSSPGPSTPAYAAPRTELEIALTNLWQDAFGLSRVSVDDDFLDLGGNSLVALQLAVRVRERLGLNLPGVALLETPTIRELAARLAEQSAGA